MKRKKKGENGEKGEEKERSRTTISLHLPPSSSPTLIFLHIHIFHTIKNKYFKFSLFK